MAASESTGWPPGATRWTAHWWRDGRARGGRGDVRYAAGMVAALAYYYLVPDPLLALPGLVAFAALAWLRLELALCLLPLTFPFWYVPKRVLGHTVFPLSEIALGICLAVAIGHVIVRMWATKNAKDAKNREGCEEGEQIRNAEDAEDRRGYPKRRERAKGHPRFPRSSANAAGRSAPAASIPLFFATSVKLRDLRVLHILNPRWRWLVIGAALLLSGTAAGVLIAVRPRDALRAFRWEVAEPLLYAALVVTCLWRRALDGSRARGPGSGTHSGVWLIGWLAGPVLAVGALFGVLGIAQVLWLRVTFTPLAAGNQLVTLPPVAGGSLLRATGIYYGSANSLGALLERVLPLALALLLWRVSGGTGNAKNAKIREEREEAERFTAEGTEETEGMGAGHAVPDQATQASPLHPQGAGKVDAPSASSAAPSSALSSVPSVSSAVNPSFVPTLLLAGCMAVMVVGLALTGSRGAEAGAAAGALLVLIAHPRTRRITLGIAVLGVVVAVWKAGALLQAALVGHGASGEVRLLLWQSALHMIRDHPLLGIGPDQFLYYYDPAYTAHPYWIPRIGGHLTPAVSQPNLAHPHNLILDLWLSGGMLGLAGFALVLGWLAWSCWHVWRSNSRLAAPGRWTATTSLAVGVAGCVFAGLAHGMVDSAYFQPDLALLFWWAVAVVALLRVGLPAQTTVHSSRSRGHRAPRGIPDETGAVR